MITPRGQRRRDALLQAVVHDIAEHGLVGFSVRRAAAAAGTTHKVLLYHFSSADQLLREALAAIRQARITHTNQQAWSLDTTLADRVKVVFTTLLDEAAGPRVLDQATGLALYNPERYTQLGKDATYQYLPDILALLPPTCPPEHRQETATLILATLRGLLADMLTSNDTQRVSAGLDAFARLLTTEQASWTEPSSGQS